MMGIVESSRCYETWLKRQIPLLKADLELKHRLMASAAANAHSGDRRHVMAVGADLRLRPPKWLRKAAAAMAKATVADWNEWRKR